MRRRIVLGISISLVSVVGGLRADPTGAPKAPERSADAIDDALATVGINRRDLGWEARGWWDRYPQAIPYKMRHVDDLFAEPLSTIPWLRSMGATVRDGLSATGLSTKGAQGAGALMKLVHDLGVQRRIGTTRPYSANLSDSPVSFVDALKLVFHDAHKATELRSFGKPADWPKIGKDLEAAAAPLPEAVSAPLGRLLADLVEAEHWARLAWRRVSLETRMACHRKLDVGIEETDGLDYEPAFDDAALAWDEASLWYAGLKVVEALDVARQALAAPVAAAKDTLAKFALDVSTPYGRVIVNGTGNDTTDVGTEGAFLVVDLGGDDHHRGGVASSSPTLPIGVLLDLSGDDDYRAADRAQGAGSLGIGILVDVAGDDHYTMTGTLGQGAGLFGLGALIDLAGNDAYQCPYSAQGCGFFGIGLLLDAAGTDSYILWSDGQGFGGVAGVGVLADRSGDDKYEAVSDPKITGRPSYHTEGKVTVSNAQGCAMGRRGDGTDGHSFAGGVGCLLDAEGNDHYSAANWSQGCGYWFGTGLIWDGGGNDDYQANGWASGSGAHFCIGCAVDEGGDDHRVVKQDWGPAFGHDFTVGICLDAAGNDKYECGASGFGWTINRSIAILIDGGGDDSYAYAEPKPERHVGKAVFDARFLDRSGSTPLYWTEPISVGLFLDAAGKDTYPAGFSDASTVVDPADSDNVKARNFGIAVDRADGKIDLDRPSRGHRR